MGKLPQVIQEVIRQLRLRLHQAFEWIRRHKTTCILVLSIVIAESHSYVPANYAEKKVNWIYSIDRTMEIQWNVKNLSDQIVQILYFLAMFFYNGNRVNKTTVVTFIVLSIIELGMYFHNYKTLHYGSVYVWTLGIWFALYNQYFIRKSVKRSLNKIG